MNVMSRALGVAVMMMAVAVNAKEAPLPADLAPWFTLPKDYANADDGRKSPLIFADGHRATTAQQWAERREEIRREWFALMGAWPELIATPRFEVVSSTHRKNFTEQRIRIEVARGMILDGYLLLPESAGKVPAVLVPYYEPESSIGRGMEHRDLGLLLSRRGIAALCIGSPGGDAYKPELAGATCQPLAFLAYIAANACTALTQQPRIDAARIGIVGHSYGGKWAMFGACFDERFRCAAWSDPGIVFDETRASINYWEPWYLGLDPKLTRARGLVTKDNPRTGAYRELVARGHDLHELHALMAPRAFLVSGGAEDPVSRWATLRHAIAVNHVLGFETRVGLHNRPTHDPTAASNEVIVRFFEHFLREDGSSQRD